MGGATVTAVTRLKKDYQKLMKDPVPYAIACPLSSNILEWHYVVFGAPETPYEGGYYHGKLIFPADFPFRPPSIYMITPSGRFQVNTRLCLSISDFHPDTWNPSWTVSTIIMGLISFMNETSPTLGSLSTSDAEKRLLSRRSRDFNLRDKQFCEIFSDLASTLHEEAEREREANASSDTNSSDPNATNNSFSVQISELESALPRRVVQFGGVQNDVVLPSTYLLILIMTRPEDFEVRGVIRDTWLRLSTKTPQLFRYAFSIGTKNLSIADMEHLHSEHRQTNDLIMLDDLWDNYNKLSMKTALSIRFAVSHYNFKFLLKVDGDSFVRLGSLLKSLKDIEHPRLYWGFLDGRAKPFRKGKWKDSSWILCDRYLPYMLGGGYVLSHSWAKFIATNFGVLKFFQSEDVSVGAWLAGLDVKYVHDPRFDTEFVSRGCHNEYLITHKKSPNEMKVLFTNVRDKGRLCLQEYRKRGSYVYDFSAPASQCCTRKNDSSIP
ncbi:galactosyltransferase domain-containing protein [Ditylenchus destructor]|nr:galactosyltransferase domain-containing protein [Ditylenchus destructor]